MSRWTKPELENMLEDVVNALDLSEGMVEQHGPMGTAPAELVRIVLARKDAEIAMLKQGFKAIEPGSVSPEPGGGQWLPIETAPRNVWGLLRFSGSHIPAIGVIDSEGRPVVDDEFQLTVTHWMPCPGAPPETKEVARPADDPEKRGKP